MLVRVFAGIFVEPNVIGWVKHEIKDSPQDDKNVLRRDKISIYAKSGALIHEQEIELHVESVRNIYNANITKALSALGYPEPEDTSKNSPVTQP